MSHYAVTAVRRRPGGRAVGCAVRGDVHQMSDQLLRLASAGYTEFWLWGLPDHRGRRQLLTAYRIDLDRTIDLTSTGVMK